MSQWRYRIGSTTHGPIASGALLELLACGRLSAETPVSRPGSGRWRAAGLTRTFEPALYPPEAFAPLPRYDDRLIGSARRRPYPPARPWVRFWARWFDVLAFSALVHTCILASGWKPGVGVGSVLGVLIVLGWVVVEAALMSTIGATPGKALLRVRVRRADGRGLDFERALTRAVEVWLKGLGMGLPVVSLITVAIAYRRLRREGVTAWDEAGDIVVSHETIGGTRIALLVLGAVVAIAAIGATGAWGGS